MNQSAKVTWKLKLSDFGTQVNLSEMGAVLGKQQYRQSSIKNSQYLLLPVSCGNVCYLFGWISFLLCKLTSWQIGSHQKRLCFSQQSSVEFLLLKMTAKYDIVPAVVYYITVGLIKPVSSLSLIHVQSFDPVHLTASLSATTFYFKVSLPKFRPWTLQRLP